MLDVDDKTPYIAGENTDQVTSALQNAAASLFKCFSHYGSKFSFMSLTFSLMKTAKRKIKLLVTLQNNKCENLLVIDIDSKFRLQV